MWFVYVIKWIKAYWYVPLILLGIVLAYIIFGKDTGKHLAEIYENFHKQHVKELEDLDKIRKEEELQKQKSVEEFEKKSKEIDEKYNEEKKNLEEKKIAEEKKILEETNRDPEKLTDELGKITGIPVDKD